eukprot:TRINITY_DN49991_c0_g1_i1.p1 TRINITY_DN49991_c0_g1~~TRINITY_DN49991_c0_g1_i1.p1  ORF type:complete len:327 (-),score=78.92 TRINITY_DN49991_c0_g1_i1:30-983(-)
MSSFPAAEAPCGILADSPISVEIIGRTSPSLLSRSLGSCSEYTVAVQCFLFQGEVVKTFKEFRQLRKELASRLREHALPVLPEDHVFGNFSEAASEKRCLLLEGFLKLLAVDCQVLQDGAFWRWLSGRAESPLARVLALAAAQAEGWAAGKVDLFAALDSDLAAAEQGNRGDELDCCLHPAVLEIFRRELEAGEDAATPIARQALGRLLARSREVDSDFSMVQLFVTNLPGTLSLNLSMDVGDSLIGVQGRILASQRGTRLKVQLAREDSVLGEEGTLYTAGILPGPEVKLTAVLGQCEEPPQEDMSEAVYKRNYGH